MILFCIALTAAISAMQGHDTLGRGWLVAIHALLLVAAMWVAGYGNYAALGLPLAAAWMYGLRGGWQAGAELDYMDRTRHPEATLLDVLIAYSPVTLLGFSMMLVDQWLAFATILSAALPALAVAIFNYNTAPGRWLSWNHGRFWDCRRATEVVAGAVGGVCIYDGFAVVRHVFL